MVELVICSKIEIKQDYSYLIITKINLIDSIKL